MKIAIVVQGRFHAFDLAKALRARGHDITILTNYPQFICKRFGVSNVSVKSFLLHGILVRTVEVIRRLIGRFPECERSLHILFGTWAELNLRHTYWDCIYSFSGVSEESLRSSRVHTRSFLLVRGSAHIDEQVRLLREESVRTRSTQQVPSDWRIVRERREYELAQHIVTLSTFAYRSFIERHIPSSKVALMPLGVNTQSFHSTPDDIEGRCARITSGAPLRVLYVGNISFQKGILDLLDIANAFSPSELTIQCVGQVTDEVLEICKTASPVIHFLGKHPQQALLHFYTSSDLFIFPTIQDGFAVVLAHALACGLPVLTTTNSGGPDLMNTDSCGWVLPIRKPDAFIERLKWCLSNRQELANMVCALHSSYQPRSWANVAEAFEHIVEGSE